MSQVIFMVQKLSRCTDLVCAATGWIEPERGSNDTGENAEERAGPGKCYGGCVMTLGTVGSANSTLRLSTRTMLMLAGGRGRCVCCFDV